MTSRGSTFRRSTFRGSTFRRSVVPFFVLCSSFFVPLAAAQPPRDATPARDAPRGTAIIRGFVVAADNGAPVRRAQVRVSGQGGPNRLATTDDKGRFEVRDLAAGRYIVTASKGGFVTLAYGQQRPSQSGTPLEISGAQVLEKIVINLPRGSVISGRVTDEFGESVANAAVTALRYGYSGGARRLLPGTGQNSRDTTDDQGHFRLFGLSPGEYVISASFRTGPLESTDPAGENTGYAPTYYPGTSNIGEAQRVTVGVGQEQSSVIFSLVATRLVRVSGGVLSSQGRPVTGGQVILTPVSGRTSIPAGLMTFSGRIEGSGQFRVTNVPPGRYIAQVRTARPRDDATQAEFGRQEITVGGEDLDGVVLATMAPGRVTGRILSDTGQPLDIRPQQVSIAARPLEPDMSTPAMAGSSRVQADWSFEVSGLYEPRLLRPSVPQGWYLKEITLNDQDITDVPLDVPPGQTLAAVQIVLTQQATEVSGRVTDTRGGGVTDVTVVIFPADESKWIYQSRFIRSMRPDQQGQFQIRGLPPLDRYLIATVPSIEDGQAGDPEFLASIRDTALAFSLKDGETRSQELRYTAR